MKIATRVGLAGCVALGALTPASANHSWGNYHWARTANPLLLRINTTLTGNWANYVSTGLGQWDQSPVLSFTSPRLNPIGGSARQCNPRAGQIVVCNSTYGQRGWLGIASIWADGDHITQGTTKLNDTYFNMARYNTSAWRALVACQEVGHNFGLGHQDENFNNANLGSCMDYTNDPTGTAGTNGTKANVAPNAHDYAQLATIYAHLDSTNTARTAAAATNFGIRQPGRAVPQSTGDAGVGDTIADWGSAVHHDGKGRPDVFKRRHRDGRDVITHVFWAPDAKGTEADH